jgi:5-formyltetrahydrofolate cyclo-ligase
MTKPELRRVIAQQRSAIAPQAFLAWSRQIVQALMNWGPFRAARNIGAYAPLTGEVDLSQLFQIPDKRFFIPALDSATGLYRLAERTGELQPGRFGIPEPTKPRFATATELDLLLVPGSAFDPSGRRLGRGGGFYDRLLPLYQAPRVGLCFAFQCVESVPEESHDIRMDWIITESHLFQVDLFISDAG